MDRYRGWRSNGTTATPRTERLPLQEDIEGQEHQALQTQLDETLAELRDVRAENQLQKCSISQLKTALDHIKNQQDQSSVQIKDLQTENKRLTNENQSQKSAIAIFTKERDARWQDSMQHKLSVAERQLRCLNHLTRHKLESREDTIYGHVKQRGPFPESKEVIAAMLALNKEICQTCVLLTKGLDRSEPSDKHKSQAQKVFGDYLTAIMEDQATKMTPAYDVLLMQSVLQVFMVHWCSSIIEAFYPKQESFADLLVQLSAQTTRISGLAAICGKQVQIVQPSKPNTDIVEFNEWVDDIIAELGLFLRLAGMRMKYQYAHIFSSKTLALIKGAYDLRTAMAEKNTSGGLEVVIVSPDTPFQEKWMDAQADPGKGDTDQLHMDFVAGTIGIGLKRKVLEKVNGNFQSRMETELKPTVILERTLNMKTNRIDSPQYLIGEV